MYKILLLYFYVFFNCLAVYSQVGNQCNLPVTGKKGVCKIVKDCPTAAKQAAVGISPVICGRQNNVPIVCCEGTATSSAALPSAPSNRPDSSIQFPSPNFNTNNNNGIRICEQKCKEYTRSVVSILEVKPLSTHSSSVSVETANCSYNGIPLIYGGEAAVLGEFPHMALLGYNKNPVYWQCGGSLISEQFILTAAHCLTSLQHGPVTTVRLGELNIKKSEPNSVPEDFDVIQTYKHPQYIRPKIYNDIALLRLSRRVQFDNYKRPACLWTKFNLETTTTIATGWGITENDSTINDALLKVGLNIIDNQECHNMYVDYFDRRLQGIERSQICARNTTHLGDTCMGDSGGPIQVSKVNNRCVFYVIGVTSAGRVCGGNIPALYTRVSEYIDWIEKIVWP